METKQLEAVYRSMLRIRRFDEGVMGLFKEGLVKGTAHSYVGTGGGGGGRVRRAHSRGFRGQPSPRPRALHRQGRLARQDDGRADGPRDRLLQRAGRLDAHRRSRPQHPGRERHRRRGYRDRDRRGALQQAARHRCGRRRVLRRRRLQRRDLPRVLERGVGVEACRWCTCARTISTRCRLR